MTLPIIEIKINQRLEDYKERKKKLRVEKKIIEG